MFHKVGIRSHSEIFQYPYPFTKCDAIFCPEFTVGAMEFPGSITYTETYMWKEDNTRTQICARGKTILHELAHMWFGNTVTMKWWNDLWLNESFADFIAYTAFDRITKLGWFGDFVPTHAKIALLTRKDWGYQADKKSTTHPIAGEVCDTNVADSIFDGITYSKGCAVLYNLFTMLGQPLFKEVMAAYFKKYEWANAELKDLLAIVTEKVATLGMGNNPHYNIAQWTTDWLDTAGLNTIEVMSWDQSLTTLPVRQGCYSDDFPTLRHHYMQFGFYDQNGEVMLVKDMYLHPLAQENHQIFENGDKFPEARTLCAILPNYGDLDFVEVKLDTASLNWFKSNMGKITDPLTSAILLNHLKSSALHIPREGENDTSLKPEELLEVCADMIQTCNDSDVLSSVLGTIFELANGYVEWHKALAFEDRLFSFIYERLKTESDSAIIDLLTPQLFANANSDSSKKILQTWFDGSEPVLGSNQKLSLSKKWQIVYKLQKCDFVSELSKQTYWDTMVLEDTTDAKRDYAVKKSILTSSPAGRQAFIDKM